MSEIAKSVGKGGRNLKPDVRAVQCLFNLSANMVQTGMKTKLTMNGVLDKSTQDAIDVFQNKILKSPRPDGRVDPNGGMIRRMMAALPPMPQGPVQTPKWLNIAQYEEGQKESGGRANNNPRILEYLATAAGLANQDDKVTKIGDDGKPVLDAKGKAVKVATGYKMSQVDETAWCACFVNWCLKEAKESPIRGALASAYSTWGTETEEFGAITVIHREPFSDSATGYHVGFWIGGSQRDGYVALLGGNQGNSVCRKWFCGIEPLKIWRRWPT